MYFWEGRKKTPESALSYILTIRERLSKMTKLVQGNMEKAQAAQKHWYDANAKERNRSGPTTYFYHRSTGYQP